MELFIISEVSEVLYFEMLRSQQRHGVPTIVCTDPAIRHKIFEETGFRSITIPLQRKADQEEIFHETFMPGVLDRYEWGDLPIWKAVSIDRLRFWSHGDETDNFMSMVELMDITGLTTTFDVHSCIPWEALAWAESIGVPTTLVKTRGIRNKECFMAAQMIPPSRLIVSFNDEAELYQRVLPDTEIVVVVGDRPKRPRVLKEKKDALRSGLGIPDDAFVTAIVYDKRDEWAFMHLAKLVAHTNKLAESIIFPYDSRSEELFDKSLPRDLVYGMLCDSPKFFAACDEIITFRYLEEVMGATPDIPVAIYDFFDRQLSSELAHDVIKVFS